MKVLERQFPKNGSVRTNYYKHNHINYNTVFRQSIDFMPAEIHFKENFYGIL